MVVGVLIPERRGECEAMPSHTSTTFYLTGEIDVGCDPLPSRLHRPPLRLHRTSKLPDLQVQTANIA
eukprot:8255130-Heterocapsa_arctica.AAC.1